MLRSQKLWCAGVPFPWYGGADGRAINIRTDARNSATYLHEFAVSTSNSAFTELEDLFRFSTAVLYVAALITMSASATDSMV